MKTIKLMFTRGDHATQPGGIILRQKPDGTYVSHHFNRAPHTRTPTEFYWGHYKDTEAEALKDYYERAARAAPFEISEAELIAKGDVALQPEFD